METITVYLYMFHPANYISPDFVLLCFVWYLIVSIPDLYTFTYFV